MKIDNAIQNGLNGFKNAQESISQSVHNIANLNNKESNVNLEKELVNLVKQEHVAKANAKVIKTANDMIGVIIDIKV